MICIPRGSDPLGPESLSSRIPECSNLVEFEKLMACVIFSKRPPWGLNIIMKIDLVKLLLSDSKGFTNVYCDQHLSL